MATAPAVQFAACCRLQWCSCLAEQMMQQLYETVHAGSLAVCSLLQLLVAVSMSFRWRLGPAGWWVGKVVMVWQGGVFNTGR
jgi:hypothetical protein